MDIETDVSIHRQNTWMSIGLLLVLTLIFMGQALLPPAGQTVGIGDMRSSIYPMFLTTRDAIREGQLPLWDPYHFSGYPFISKPQVSVFYPPTWLGILLPANIGISWYVALHVWLVGVGMLLLIRYMHRSWLAAILAGLTLSFNGFMAARIYGGHIGPLATFSWLPWLLLAFLWSVDRGDVWSAVIGGLPLALAALSGHPPSVLYVALIWGSFIIYMMLFPPPSGKTHRVRWLIIRQVVITSVMGLCLSAVQLVPFAELSLLSTRTAEPSLEFSTRFSMPPARLITLLIPEFFGEPIRAGCDSVPDFVELTYYAGLLPVLSLVPALRRPARRTWFYVCLSVLGLLLALGSHGFLYVLAYQLLPPFRLMRVPGRSALLVLFAATALLADTIDRWEHLSDEDREVPGIPLHRALVIVAVIGTGGLAIIGALFTVQYPGDMSGRLWHVIGGWALALTFALIGGVLLWAYLDRVGVGSNPTPDRAKGGLAVGLVILLLADLWTFGLKLVQLEPVAPALIWSEAYQIIGQTNERVLPWGLSIFEQNGAGQVGLRSVFGYSPIEVDAVLALASSVPDPRSAAYDILGAGYVIAGGPLDEYTQGERPLELVKKVGSAWVYRRARVLPVARLAYQVEVIEDADTTIKRVHQPDFNPSTTVILDRQPPCQVGPEPGLHGTTRVVETRPGVWLIDVDSDAPGLLVLSETAYPGWKVTVDGQQADALTAYTAVRAVCVPAGSHRVEWTFDPSSLKLGALVTTVALLVFGWAGLSTFRRNREERKEV